MAEAVSDAREVIELIALLEEDLEDSSNSEDEEDLELLYCELAFSVTPKGSLFQLHSCSDADFEQQFRFKKPDFERLLVALQLPENYIAPQRTKATGREALLVLLRRLAYPCRWCDFTGTFGRAEGELSAIFNEVLQYVYARFHHLLEDLEDLEWLDAPAFAAAVQNAGAPLDNCWNFIDGTARPIARPVRNQRVMYSGHKRVHCIKFQAVTAPNGLIVNMYGPVAGHCHDAYMLTKSGLQSKLANFTKQDGTPFIIYDDPAYSVSSTILSPFQGSGNLRVSVEWTFGKLIMYFSYLDYKRGNEILLQPIAKCYLVAALLTNCHTCLYGSQTSTFLVCHLHP